MMKEASFEKQVISRHKLEPCFSITHEEIVRKLRNKLTSAISASALIGLIPVVCQASSFQILEQSPALLGTAFSGTASIANDATTVYFNPAGMTELDTPQFSVAGNLIMVESDFRNQGSTAADGTALQQPLNGAPGKTDESAFVPNFYYVQALTERWRFGLGINAPFGLASEYEDDWIGRYHGTESELTVININPTVAYALSNQLSVGIGVSYQRADTKLKNAVDSFGACMSAPGSDALTCGAAHGSPANSASDSRAEIEGDDSDVVADLSVYWHPLEASRVGLIWRQGGQFTLAGHADFSRSASCNADPFCSGALQALDGKVEADLELPDTLTLSASQRVNDSWEVHADIAWTEWSSIKKVDIMNIENDQKVSTLDLQYDDTLRYAFGMSFEPEGRWTWRFGLAFDEAPQSAAEFVTVRIPDQDRFWISVGFNFAISENASIDAGYAHIRVDDSQINKVEQGHRLTGDFDASANIFGLQGNWRF